MKPQDQLWDEFLNLGEKYSTEMCVSHFGHLLIMFSTKMLMDCAPSDSDCMKLIKQAVDDGIEWHTNEQNEED